MDFKLSALILVLLIIILSSLSWTLTFSCNTFILHRGTRLTQVAWYCYLGIEIHQSGSFSLARSSLKNKAMRALFSLNIEFYIITYHVWMFPLSNPLARGRSPSQDLSLSKLIHERQMMELRAAHERKVEEDIKRFNEEFCKNINKMAVEVRLILISWGLGFPRPGCDQLVLISRKQL